MVAITAATVLTLAQLQHDSLSPFPIARLLTDCKVGARDTISGVGLSEASQVGTLMAAINNTAPWKKFQF